MFAQLKERLEALREFHAVHGLTWKLPSLCRNMIAYVWIGGIARVVLYLTLPFFMGHAVITDWWHTITSIVIGDLFATVILASAFTLINLIRNAPAVTKFLRDPTYENE